MQIHPIARCRQTLAANASANPLDVVKIKSTLKALGHYDAPEWGVSPYPDAALFDAIEAFQKSQGLSVDGAIKPDGETEAALSRALSPQRAQTALQTTAQALQSMGRGGDEILAHITPEEAALLHQITDGVSVNPVTGLMEFSLFGGAPDSDSLEQNVASAADSDIPDDDFWSGYEETTAAYDEANSDGVAGNEDDFSNDYWNDVENPTRQQYERALKSKKGWDRFVYGTKHGWKNWNSTQPDGPGVYDYDLGRKLTKEDFAKGGVRDPEALGQIVQKNREAFRQFQNAEKREAARRVAAIQGMLTQAKALEDEEDKGKINEQPDGVETQPSNEAVLGVAAPNSVESDGPPSPSTTLSNQAAVGVGHNPWSSSEKSLAIAKGLDALGINPMSNMTLSPVADVINGGWGAKLTGIVDNHGRTGEEDVLGGILEETEKKSSYLSPADRRAARHGRRDGSDQRTVQAILDGLDIAQRAMRKEAANAVYNGIDGIFTLTSPRGWVLNPEYRDHMEGVINGLVSPEEADTIYGQTGTYAAKGLTTLGGMALGGLPSALTEMGRARANARALGATLEEQNRAALQEAGKQVLSSMAGRAGKAHADLGLEYSGLSKQAREDLSEAIGQLIESLTPEMLDELTRK